MSFHSDVVELVQSGQSSCVAEAEEALLTAKFLENHNAKQVAAECHVSDSYALRKIGRRIVTMIERGILTVSFRV